MVEDPELLRQYSEQKTDAAFGEFVRRHVDLVYGSALRRVGGDTHLAEDVAQQVFAAAAREAARLCRHPAIVGWLFAATRNRAAQLVRAERRRHLREQKAYAMSTPPPEPVLDWDKLRPFIDTVLDELSEADRQAVLLRFFENRSYAEIAAQLHTAENAARMRVDRALDRLNAQLQRKGVTSTTVALATVLLADAVTAAPAGVAVTTTAAALSAGAAGTSGSLLALMGLTKLHLAAAATAVAVGATGWVVEQRAIHRDRVELAALGAQTDTDAADAAAEKSRLQQQFAEAEHRAQANAATLAELQNKIAAANQQLTALKAEVAKAPSPAASRTQTGPVYDVKALDKAPQATLRVPPQYPVVLRNLGVPGKALVDFVVGSDGQVTNAYAVQTTSPEFAEAAVAAVAQWEFSPGEMKGAPVNTHMQIPIVFELASPGASKTPPATAPDGPAKAYQVKQWF